MVQEKVFLKTRLKEKQIEKMHNWEKHFVWQKKGFLKTRLKEKTDRKNAQWGNTFCLDPQARKKICLVLEMKKIVENISLPPSCI